MANTIEMKIKLNGAGEVVAQIKGVERATKESANNQASSWDKAGSKVESFGQKINTALISRLALGVASAQQVLPGLVGAVGAVGVSFAATGLAVGVFGAMVKTALTDMKKGSTQAGKDASASLKSVKDQWHNLSDAVAIPVLVPVLDAASKAMTHLRPLVQPVADQFAAWGKSMDRYFSSSKGSAELTKIATAVGKFAGGQLKSIGTFLIDAGKGIANLARDIHGVNFGAFGDALGRWGAAFLSWSGSSAARKDVNKFLDWLHGNGGQVVGIVKSLAKDLPAIVKGLSGAGSIQLAGISAFFTVLSKLPPSVLTAIVVAAPFTIVLAKGLQLVAGATKAWAAAQAILDAALEANPIGLIVLGIAGLVTALVIAWQTSAKFRDIVIGVFSVVGQVVLTFAEIWLNEMHAITSIFLDVVGIIIHGAADAFGWVPGVGGKLKGAAAAFDNFKNGVSNTFDAAHRKIEGWKNDLRNMPKVAKLKGDISDLTNKLNNAKAQLRDPHLTATKRAAIQANIRQLQQAIGAARAQLDNINGKTAYTYVKVVSQGVSYNISAGGLYSPHAAGGAVGAAAGGGARNGLVMVGEHGRELVRLPGGSTVHSNPDTESMMGSGGRSGITIEVGSTGNQAFDALMLEWLRTTVRIKGGGNVQRALGKAGA